MNPRQRTEALEQKTLSPYAAKSAQSAGRARPEAQCELRTVYQRDRDRIIHSKAFRRLKQKTQVFLSPQGDHYRTRLTHTLEVSQIARTIARAMQLNEDLTEAIALGHDLGHTPFGHAGERALNALMPGGFKHNEQSVRVVNHLEKNHRGLNLTAEVLDGLACHTAGTWAKTMEGGVVRYADRIAYMNHDIEDAISAGVLTQQQLPADVLLVLGETKSERITTLITSLIENSQNGTLAMAPDVDAQYKALYAFMHNTVYVDPEAKAEEDKVEIMIGTLYDKLLRVPERMPDFYIEIAGRDGTEQAVGDYISGMSDDFAIQVFEELFIPRKWSK